MPAEFWWGNYFIGRQETWYVKADIWETLSRMVPLPILIFLQSILLVDSLVPVHSRKRRHIVAPKTK